MSRSLSIFLPLIALLAPGVSLAAEDAIPAQAQTETADPVRDYVLDFETHSDEQIITSTIDLNGDGTDEVLISRNTLSNGRQGNIWTLYESAPGGIFVRRDALVDGGPIEFHRAAVSHRPRANGQGRELLRYSPGSGREGWLTTFALGENGVTETALRELTPFEDGGLYESLFENPDTRLVFELQDAGPLRKKYLPFGGWFRSMTLAKWAILGLGALILLVLLLNLLQTFRRQPHTP